MVDVFAAERMALQQFGHDVLVQGRPDPVRMLFDDVDADAALGGLRGPVASPTFWCLPEEDENIGEGTTLTLDGTSYQVFDAIPRRNQMTEIRAK